MAVEGAPSYADLQRRLAQAERALAEAQQREAEAAARESLALEHQTATSEVLRVIAGSPRPSNIPIW